MRFAGLGNLEAVAASGRRRVAEPQTKKGVGQAHPSVYREH